MASWFDFIKKRGQNGSSRGRVAISFSREGVALAHCLYDEAGVPKLQFCEFYPQDERAIANEAAWLARLVQSHKLNGVACSWILLPDEYTFMTLPAPDVPPEKINMAVRWQIRELIDFPLEEALIETCPVPELGYTGRHMLHAVVARHSQLLPRKKAIQDSGLILTVIDVAELTLGNMAHRFSGKGHHNIVILRLSPDCTMLTLFCSDSLSFSRRTEIEFNTINDDYISSHYQGTEVPPAFEMLTLTIQQSLDYFESQMGQVPPSVVVIMPLPFKADRLKSYLDEHLSPDVISADLNTVLEGAPLDLRPEVQSQCTLVIGGLLGTPEDYYAPTN